VISALNIEILLTLPASLRGQGSHFGHGFFSILPLNMTFGNKTIFGRACTASSKSNLDDEVSIIKRFNAIYFIGRLVDNKKNNVSLAIKTIKDMITVEKDLRLKLMLYVSAVALEDLSLEEELINIIEKNKEASNIIRGYFIAYYSGNDLYNYKEFNFSDSLEYNIYDVIKTILQHFSFEKLHYYCLRRLDLTLIIHYIRFRNSANQIDQTNFEKIMSFKHSNFDTIYPDYARKLHNKFDEFENFYKNICKSKP
jgi:hypothetical protein